MKAVVIAKYGPAESAFEVREIPKPVPSGRDLLVKVRAVSVNPVDTKVRKNVNAAPRENHTLGFDGAGEVEAVGGEVKLFNKGEKVFFAGNIQKNGTNAEYILVDERIVGKMPEGDAWSFEKAAAIPLTGLTAWEGLEEQLGLVANNPDNSSKSILVVSGAGGVGSIVIPLAKKVFGLGKVIATASRPETIEFVKKLGADEVINHREDLLEQLKKIGYPTGVNYIFYCAEADEGLEKTFPAITHFGKIVCITGSSKPINVLPLFAKRATLTWEMMFTRSITGIEIEKQHKILTNLASLAEKGIIPDSVTKVYSLKNELAQAHKEQESGNAIGKLVLKMDL